MPKVLFFEYGDAVTYNRETKNINLKNTMQKIVVDNFPTLYTFSCNFIITEIDCKTNNIVKYELLSGNKKVLATDNIELKERQIPNMKDDAVYGVSIGVDFRNVPIESQQKLTTNIYFNNDLLGSYYINVEKKG